MSKKPVLNNADHENMDAFLSHVLEDYKAGKITKDAGVSALAHVMAALDQDNYEEARSWFRQGRSFLSKEPFTDG